MPTGRIGRVLKTCPSGIEIQFDTSKLAHCTAIAKNVLVDGGLLTVFCFSKSMFLRLLLISYELLVAIRDTATKNPDQRCYSYFISFELTMS